MMASARLRFVLRLGDLTIGPRKWGRRLGSEEPPGMTPGGSTTNVHSTGRPFQNRFWTGTTELVRVDDGEISPTLIRR